MYQLGICMDDGAEKRMMVKILGGGILHPVKIHIYDYGEELEQEIQHGNICADIFLIDIHLKRADGIALARQLQKAAPRVRIIFLTDETYMLPDIFEAEPTDLLVFPVAKDSLTRAVERAIRHIEAGERDMLRLYSKNKLCSIRCREILYIESDCRYLLIHRRGRVDRVLMKMSEILELLPDYFVRCHQSFTVNMHWVVGMAGKKLLLEGVEEQIPVSKSRYHEVKASLFTYLSCS